MVKRIGLACLIFVLLSATAASALSRNARITTAGLGPVKIGMTERQVEKAAKRSVRREGGASTGCTTATFGRRSFFLFTGKRLARIYVGTSRYATRSGIRVGDSEQQVLRTYPGDIVRTPHQYTPGGSYLKIVDGNRKVVFETDGSKVTQISTGRRPEIDYVEACS